MEKQSQNQLQKLQNRIAKKGKTYSSIESVVDLIRELSCLSDVIGRTYEVCDPEGKIVFTIKQKPITSIQLNVLLRELNDLKAKEQGLPKGNKMLGRGRR